MTGILNHFVCIGTNLDLSRDLQTWASIDINLYTGSWEWRASYIVSPEISRQVIPSNFALKPVSLVIQVGLGETEANKDHFFRTKDRLKL